MAGRPKERPVGAAGERAMVILGMRILCPGVKVGWRGAPGPVVDGWVVVAGGWEKRSEEEYGVWRIRGER